MQSYWTIDRGKAEIVLFKMGSCLWICRDSNILKSVILLDVPFIVKSWVCTMYIGIAGKAMVSNTALTWLGNGEVRPWTNSYNGIYILHWIKKLLYPQKL